MDSGSEQLKVPNAGLDFTCFHMALIFPLGDQQATGPWHSRALPGSVPERARGFDLSWLSGRPTDGPDITEPRN